LVLGRGLPGWARALNLTFAITRLGVLGGTARAYERQPWTYWLSPLADLPVAVALIANTFRSEHTWRGRTVARRATSEPVAAGPFSAPAPEPQRPVVTRARTDVNDAEPARQEQTVASRVGASMPPQQGPGPRDESRHYDDVNRETMIGETR
jgi:hypothetical protein